MQQDLLQRLAPSQYTSLSHSQALYHSLDKQSLLRLTHPKFSAVIALQGAQLLSFCPQNQPDWFWLQPRQSFHPGSPILGGIPICAPWFGAVKQPLHGFVQRKPWVLAGLEESQSHIRLTFCYQHEKDTKGSTAFTLWHSISLSSSGLELELHWQNNSLQIAKNLSFAWHSYFACTDNLNQAASLSGLENLLYYDNLQGLSQHLQQGKIVANKALDRVFCYANAPLQLQAANKLTLSGNRCPSTIVWRPEAGDKVFGSNAYRNFLCVEKGSVFDNAFSLKPKQTLTATLRITC